MRFEAVSNAWFLMALHNIVNFFLSLSPPHTLACSPSCSLSLYLSISFVLSLLFFLPHTYLLYTPSPSSFPSPSTSPTPFPSPTPSIFSWAARDKEWAYGGTDCVNGGHEYCAHALWLRAPSLPGGICHQYVHTCWYTSSIYIYIPARCMSMYVHPQVICHPSVYTCRYVSSTCTPADNCTSSYLFSSSSCLYLLYIHQCICPWNIYIYVINTYSRRYMSSTYTPAYTFIHPNPSCILSISSVPAIYQSVYKLAEYAIAIYTRSHVASIFDPADHFISTKPSYM